MKGSIDALYTFSPYELKKRFFVIKRTTQSLSLCSKKYYLKMHCKYNTIYMHNNVFSYAIFANIILHDLPNSYISI